MTGNRLMHGIHGDTTLIVMMTTMSESEVDEDLTLIPLDKDGARIEATCVCFMHIHKGEGEVIATLSDMLKSDYSMTVPIESYLLDIVRDEGE